MKKMFVLAIALMVISAPAFAANLVQNGDFSAGEANWTRWNSTSWGGGFQWDASAGDGFLQTASGSFGWYQAITVVPGVKYVIDCVWEGSGSSAWSEVLLFNDNGDIMLNQLDQNPVENGRVIAKYDSWGLGSYPFGPITLSAMPAGQLLIGTREVVATGTTMFVGLKCGSGGGGVATAFDNVTVFAVPEPASMLALLGGLGGLLIRRKR